MGRIRGAALTGYAAVAEEVGLDPRAMLRRLGIDSRALDQPELRLPADNVLELFELSAELSGCETFGLRMAHGRRLPDYGPISLVMAHQKTARDALQVLVRYQRMLNEVLLISVEDQPDGLVMVREELLSDRLRSLRQSYEICVGTLAEIFRGPTGPTLTSYAVHFTHAPPKDLSLHRRMFGPDLHFNSSFNGLVCTRAAMDAHNRLADADLARHAERFIATMPYADATTLTAEVQKAIHQFLPENGAAIAVVAARLGMNERTLQRRLGAEGVDFTRILNQIRRNHALRYLESPQTPLAEVAGLLGYSRETSFGRWFAAEFGITPSRWRAIRRETRH